jgi:hypothetical protein
MRDGKLIISSDPQPGWFPLVDAAAATILVSPQDHKVVHIAAEDLSKDIERVAGKKANIQYPTRNVQCPSEEKRESEEGQGEESDAFRRHAVIVGTIGASTLIDQLARAGKIDISGIAGKWECFITAVITDPLPGIAQALVIAGSDRRGTAFGIYDLCEQIGISPWHWWADVPPCKRKAIFVSPQTAQQGPPSVKYRGIFINDEDWGLQPWAAKTFEPETGDIGPKTYAKMFELMLRLKANQVWPAMHECTKAFNLYPRNRQVADDYAIVMGSSHCEPMLRNNLSEWDARTRGEWNYQTNRDGVVKYWDERMRENGGFENVFTIGMRGIHDGRMPGTGTIEEKVKLLEQIFADQRKLLEKAAFRSSIQRTEEEKMPPQLFCAYKEVLELYQNGLKVPDDVTLGWADDNFGYIRQLSTPDEQRRAGGSGIYYHVSYWGRPQDYLWLTTTPPALIWEEMSKAYDYGARTVWILNVGDLKAAEVPTEFFLRLGWNIKKGVRPRGSDSQDIEKGGQTPFFNNASDPVFASDQFLAAWAGREFGQEFAARVAEVMSGYYRLGFARKPEHMGWSSYFETVRRTEFSPVAYGDEAAARLAEYERVRLAAEAIYDELPQGRRDAFYELVLYPVRCAELMNQKFLYADRSYLHKFQGRASTIAFARDAGEAFAAIHHETARYNDEVAGGKWRGVMSSSPRGLTVFNMVETGHWDVPGRRKVGVAVEGHVRSLVSEGEPDPTVDGWAKGTDEQPDMLPVFSRYTRRRHFVDVFAMGTDPVDWSASANEPWILLSECGGRLGEDVRAWVDIDWCKAPVGERVKGSIVVKGGGAEFTVKLEVFNPAGPDIEVGTYVEDGGVVAMNAACFTRKSDSEDAGWQTIGSLGRSGRCMAVYPTTAASTEDQAKAPLLEYDFHTFTTGAARVRVAALPTHRIHPWRGLRYAMAIDDEKPRVVDIDANRDWSDGVLRNAVWTTGEVAIRQSGLHTLKIWMVDPGVLLDRIVIDLGGLLPSYMGPAETRVAGGG